MISSQKGYYEIVIKDLKTNQIILIDESQKEGIVEGQIYSFHYKKWYGRNYYRVTKYEMI
jgi:hypothetical protein